MRERENAGLLVALSVPPELPGSESVQRSSRPVVRPRFWDWAAVDLVMAADVQGPSNETEQ